MNTELKIYTAEEVANAGISQKRIDEELAIITQRAYRTARAGRSVCTHHAANMNLLEQAARHLEDLGYIAEITEKAILGPTLILRWNSKEAEPAPRAKKTEEQETN